MTQVYRLDITKQNCWLCDHFRRNDGTGDPNEGGCTRNAPKGRGAVVSPGAAPGTQQDDISCPIAAPQTTVCGDFKKWFGAARELSV